MNLFEIFLSVVLLSTIIIVPIYFLFMVEIRKLQKKVKRLKKKMKKKDKRIFEERIKNV